MSCVDAEYLFDLEHLLILVNMNGTASVGSSSRAAAGLATHEICLSSDGHVQAKDFFSPKTKCRDCTNC